MKKITLIAIVVLSVLMLASAANAQLGMKGIKVGLNMANFGGDVEDTDMKMGLVAGGFITYNLGVIELQPEVLFSMQGCKYDFGDETYSLKFNYLEIPVLVKYNFTMPGTIKPNVFAGPAFGFLLSAKDEDVDIKDYYKSMDMGLAFGAGITTNLQAYKLLFDVRYTMGLMNIYDEEEGEDYSVKNAVISVNAGIGF